VLYDCMDAGGRATQEQLPRHSSANYGQSGFKQTALTQLVSGSAQV